jgi:hypothetical protein
MAPHLRLLLLQLLLPLPVVVVLSEQLVLGV